MWYGYGQLKRLYPQKLYIVVGKTEAGEYKEELWEIELVKHWDIPHLVLRTTMCRVEDIVDFISGDLETAVKEFIRKGYYQNYYLWLRDGSIIKIRPPP